VDLRFVGAGEPIIERDSLTCLRTIACSEQTERVMSDALREGAYAAWERARRDIHEEWMFYTDPLNLQPKVRPAMRRAAAAVRRYPPAGLSQEAVDEVVNALEAPWGARIEAQIRVALGETANAAAAARVVEAVRRLKLRPYEASEPLPVIGIEEVGLVCWMGVEAG
jgi:hypothetical protein